MSFSAFWHAGALHSLSMTTTTQKPNSPGPPSAAAGSGTGTGAGAGRIVALDVARGIAVAAMIVAHLYPPPGLAGELFSGFPAALFAALSGVSLHLMMGRGKPDGSRRRCIAVIVRGLILIALGTVMAPHTGTIVVVLTVTGLGYVVGGLARIARWRLPALAGLFVALVAVAAAVHLWAVNSPIPGILREPYPLPLWLAYLVAGVIAGRLLVGRTRTALLGVAGTGAALAAGGIAARDILGAATSTQPVHALVDATAHSGGLIDTVATTGGAIAVIAMCMTAVRGAAEAFAFPFAATGAMSLTVYTAHALSFGAVVGVSNQIYFPGLAAITLLAAVTFCTVWRSFFRRGPLEAALAWAASRTARAFAPTHSS